MKALLFVPVKEDFLKKWEYYQVDLDVLTELFPQVIVCTSIWQIIKNFKNSKLIYCWWWHRSFPVIIIAKLLGIKTCVTGAIHMFDISGGIDFYTRGWLYRTFVKGALALADYNFFISYDQFLQITSHLKVNNPIFLSSSLHKSNNVDAFSIIAERKKIRDVNPITKPKIRFLTVVWHTLISYKRKGIFAVLSALARLKEKHGLIFEWSIVGEIGNGIDVLKQEIDKLNLSDNVKIVINVSQEVKAEYYLSSDLYLQPSWYEGFGNSVLEAMSFGLPALVSRYTAQPEVVKDSGFIIMEISVDDIYHKLLEFIKLTDNDRLLLTKRVLDIVHNHFTFNKRLAQHKQIFLENGIINE